MKLNLKTFLKIYPNYKLFFLAGFFGLFSFVYLGCQTLQKNEASNNPQVSSYKFSIEKQKQMLEAALKADFDNDPEKAILNAQDFILANENSDQEYLAQLIRLKNYIKIKENLDIYSQYASSLADYQKIAGVIKLQSIQESLNLRCTLYCDREILYLSFISHELFQIALTNQGTSEKPQTSEQLDTYKKVSEIFQKYFRFYSFQVSNTELNPSNRKKIALSLFDSLQKINQSHTFEMLRKNELQLKQTSIYNNLAVELHDLQSQTEVKIYDNK